MKIYRCKICNAPISYRSTVKPGKNRCRPCFYKYLSKIKTGVKRPLSIRKKLSESMKGRIAWNKGKSCPQTTGAKNGSWKGGITKLHLKIRNSTEYANWRTKVFERDNYTCQDCGARSGVNERVILNAHHHKETFSFLMRKYQIKSYEEAISCPYLWEIKLGQTLCYGCHNKTKHGREVYH